MSAQLRHLLFLSLFVALLAFALPWLTHFADRGISVALILLWIGLVIAAVVKHGWRGLWLLLGVPLALFWPAVVIIWASGPMTIGF